MIIMKQNIKFITSLSLLIPLVVQKCKLIFNWSDTWFKLTILGGIIWAWLCCRHGLEPMTDTINECKVKEKVLMTTTVTVIAVRLLLHSKRWRGSQKLKKKDEITAIQQNTSQVGVRQWPEATKFTNRQQRSYKVVTTFPLNLKIATRIAILLH